MEGGAFQSKSLARASRDYVFVFLHQTRDETVKSYKLITQEYLPEEFLHPVYFFLRPDGTEADKENRFHHVALPGQKILSILKDLQREWGRGLDRESWVKARDELEVAEQQCLKGDWDGARKTFEGVARLKARCGVKDEAAVLLDSLEARKSMLAAWEALEGVPEPLAKQVAAALAAGNFPDAWRAIRNHRGSAKIEPVSAFRERIEELLLAGIRLNPVRMDRWDLSGRTYWLMRAEFETRLPRFDGLVIQLSFLTERERTHESYAILDEVAPYRHHRAACCLDSRQLHLADVVNLKVELWLDDLPLHTATWKKEPAAFPLDDSHVLIGPTLMEPEQTLGAGGRYEVRENPIGRYPAAR